MDGFNHRFNGLKTSADPRTIKSSLHCDASENTSRKLQKELYIQAWLQPTLNTCLLVKADLPTPLPNIPLRKFVEKNRKPFSAVGPAKSPTVQNFEMSLSWCLDSIALPDSHAGNVCQECPTFFKLSCEHHQRKSLCYMAVSSNYYLIEAPGNWSHRFCVEHGSNQLDKAIDFYNCTCTVVLDKAISWEYLFSAAMGKHQWVTCFDTLSLLSLPTWRTLLSRGPFVVEKYMVNSYSLLNAALGQYYCGWLI